MGLCAASVPTPHPARRRVWAPAHPSSRTVRQRTDARTARLYIEGNGTTGCESGLPCAAAPGYSVRLTPADEANHRVSPVLHRPFERYFMNTNKLLVPRGLATVAALTLVIGLSACAGMSKQQQNTAIGAGVGAVGGAVLTGGGTLGTLGGAAIGGVIGSQVEPRK